LLFMSPSYQSSMWCQRELGNFVAASGGHPPAIFVVEMDPVDPKTWHSSLLDVKPVRFWTRDVDRADSLLLGYPVPNLDEHNPYWRLVNELAHFIATHLQNGGGDPAPRRPKVVLAETTDDLLDVRDSLAATLRQAEYEVAPQSGYPRDSENAYRDAFSKDLRD